MNRSTKTMRIAALIAALTFATLSASACSAATEQDVAAVTMAEQVTMSDAWVKEPTMPSMTALFGELNNTGSNEIVLVGGSTSVSEMVEIHEVVAGEMQQLEGGLVIAPGASSALTPGGNHVMLMGLTAPLRVGEEVTVTLTFADGSSFDVTGIVKSSPGGEESYNEDAEMGM